MRRESKTLPFTLLVYSPPLLCVLLNESESEVSFNSKSNQFGQEQWAILVWIESERKREKPMLAVRGDVCNHRQSWWEGFEWGCMLVGLADEMWRRKERSIVWDALDGSPNRANRTTLYSLPLKSPYERCVRIDRYSHQRQVESPALHYKSRKFMTSLELTLVVEWSQGDINHLSSNSRLSATDYDAHYFRICFMAREFLAISSYSPLFDMTHNDACSNIDVHVHAHIFIYASCQSLDFAVEPKREQISFFRQKCDAFNKKALCLQKKI